MRNDKLLQAEKFGVSIRCYVGRIAMEPCKLPFVTVKISQPLVEVHVRKVVSNR